MGIRFDKFQKDRSEFKQAEEELLLIKEAAENASNGMIITDSKGFYAKYVNKSFMKLFGYSLAELNAMGGVPSLFPKQTIAGNVYSTLMSGDSWRGELNLKTSSNQTVTVFLYCKALKDMSGCFSGIFGVYSDITKRRLAEAALIESKRRLMDIINFLPDATLVVDSNGKVTYWNYAAEALTGVKAEDMLGMGNYEYALPFYGKRRPILIDIVLAPDNKKMQKFYSLIEKKGQIVKGEGYCPATGAYLRATASPLYDSQGNLVGAIESIRDATEQKYLEETMRQQSLFDPLTGLKNRTFFQQQLQRIENESLNNIGIIVCDLDGLKLINDSMGHKVGDELLKATAKVLNNCFREDDFVARVGGDEFVILLRNTNRSKLEYLLQRVRLNLEKSNAECPELPLSLSLGFALSDDKNKGILELYKEADDNMYHEKFQKKQSKSKNTVLALMKALGARDAVSEPHADRLKHIIWRFSQHLGLSEQVLNDLPLLAQFHDIGKVGIPVQILNKPGPLTPDEYCKIQKHCKIGYNIALSSPDMAPYANLILKHHEWWNGQGYPLGLKGEEIPLECRILAVVDAFDVMTHDRPYRPAMDSGQAIAELIRYSGTQFDSALVVKFISFLQNHSDNDLGKSEVGIV